MDRETTGAGVEALAKYFPALTARQLEQFAALGPLYEEWNGRINVISRREMAGGEFYTRHVLHSLAIARVCSFEAGARVMDIGTGGGFPAVPLAIMFPGARFTAVDSIGKKIGVVREVARAVGLTNLEAVNGRAETLGGPFDHVVSRAVAPAAELVGWARPRRGFLLLKGGDLSVELAAAGRPYKEYRISDWFAEEFFETKKVIHIT